MVFNFLRGEGSDRLESIEAKVQQMLRHDRHEVELCMKALLGEVEPASVNDELRSTDRMVNQLEREIRRELIVHSSVFGGIDTPAVLVYMSVVKDIERVGDYAKNILDLGLDGADFSTLPDADEWRRLARGVAEYVTDCGAAFQKGDLNRSRDLLTRGDNMLHSFDDRVSALVRGDDQGDQAVARALAFRYLKRIVAHLMNLLSATVMPLARLDFFDQDPEDRSAR
jgi:phosphate transport system protein